MRAQSWHWDALEAAWRSAGGGVTTAMLHMLACGRAVSAAMWHTRRELLARPRDVLAACECVLARGGARPPHPIFPALRPARPTQPRGARHCRRLDARRRGDPLVLDSRHVRAAQQDGPAVEHAARRGREGRRQVRRRRRGRARRVCGRRDPRGGGTALGGQRCAIRASPLRLPTPLAQLPGLRGPVRHRLLGGLHRDGLRRVPRAAADPRPVRGRHVAPRVLLQWGQIVFLETTRLCVGWGACALCARHACLHLRCVRR